MSCSIADTGRHLCRFQGGRTQRVAECAGNGSPLPLRRRGGIYGSVGGRRGCRSSVVGSGKATTMTGCRDTWRPEKMSGPPTRAVMAFLSSSFVAGLIVLLTSQDGPPRARHGGNGLDRCDRRAGRDGVICLAVAHPRPITGLRRSRQHLDRASLSGPPPQSSSRLDRLHRFFCYQRRLCRLFFTAPDGCSTTLGVATIVVTVQAVRVAMTGHPALAWVDWWLIVEVNVALPLGGQILVRALAGGFTTRRYRSP